MASASGIIPVANETESSSSRITKEGKKITYRMRVIQQPERARACGSGAKCKSSIPCLFLNGTNKSPASADRRPVDPPPIVELKIFEGPNAETDVTFSYNANFFLFATLANARHLAQGRVPAPSQPAFPVLTGTPVAGMAYLDRPEPAGYFIFPDLSVRHEGKYRLGFSLYEELKEQKDMDSETPQYAELQKSAHVSHRLEVKSQPFTVFSAKKFPGLTESTQLSRTVAEQGCRVRIRRDVRMRRRENKAGRDFDEEYEEEYTRRRASATPDAYNQVGTPRAHPDGSDRPRSVSNASQYGVLERKSSIEQMSAGYPQPYSSPMGPPQAGYGNQPQQWQQPPPPQMAYMQPPQPAYSQQSYPGPPPPNMAGQGYFMPPQLTSYDHSRHNSVEFPRPPTGPAHAPPASQAPVSQYPASSAPMSQYGNMNGGYSQHRQMSLPPQLQPIQTGHPPVPNTMPQSAAAYAPASAPAPMPKVESIVSPTYPRPVEESPAHNGYYDATQQQKYSVQPQPSGATKRSYSASFNTEHMDQRLQHGARPSSSTSGQPYAGYGLDCGVDDDGAFDAEAAMLYRRADGTERRRLVPSLN
jgi:hypothetical protein